jgi:hypothetical protein
MNTIESSNVYYNSSLTVFQARSDFDPSKPENYQRLYEDVVEMVRQWAAENYPKLEPAKEKSVEFAILYEWANPTHPERANEMWVGTLRYWPYASHIGNNTVVLRRMNRSLTIEGQMIELEGGGYQTRHIQTMYVDYVNGSKEGVIVYGWDRVRTTIPTQKHPCSLPVSPVKMVSALADLVRKHRHAVAARGLTPAPLCEVIDYVFRDSMRGLIPPTYPGDETQIKTAIHAYFDIKRFLLDVDGIEEGSGDPTGPVKVDPDRGYVPLLESLSDLVRVTGAQKVLHAAYERRRAQDPDVSNDVPLRSLMAMLASEVS